MQVIIYLLRSIPVETFRWIDIHAGLCREYVHCGPMQTQWSSLNSFVYIRVIEIVLSRSGKRVQMGMQRRVVAQVAGFRRQSFHYHCTAGCIRLTKQDELGERTEGGLNANFEECVLSRAAYPY